MRTINRLFTAAAFAVVILANRFPAAAEDWPQILGPSRNGVATNEKIADQFPATGPRTLWEMKVGPGFSGTAVLNEVAYVFHRVDNKEALEARNANSGNKVWTVDFPTNFSASFTSDNGPRCVPLVTEKRIYLYGAGGGLYCLNTKTGDKIWERQTAEEFNAPDGFFGVGSTPLLEGDMLIVNVGSRDGAGVVAFDAETGKTRWKATDNQASYSSPIAATIGKTRHVIAVTRYNTISLNPKDGSVRFSIPFGKRGPTVNGANPVVVGDKLFLTASYGIGSLVHRITDTSAEEIWKSGEIASQYSTFVATENTLFGFDGRQDAGSATLVCFDIKSSKIRWKQSNFDYGSLIMADNKLIILTNGGDLILVKASADKYEELAKSRVLSASPSGYRLPALSDGRLYIRDDSKLKCIDIGK